MMYLSQERKVKRKNYRNITSLLVLILLLVTLSFSYTVYLAKLDFVYVVALLWILTVIVLLWFGNKLIFHVLDERLTWSKQTTRRFFLQLFMSSVYSLLCINGTYYFFKTHTTAVAPDLAQIFVLNVYGLLFIIPVLSISFGIYFMTQWKKAHLQSDKLKEENLRTQLESLKMQLDPHFLFNNLNILSSLIEQDPKEAQNFLDEFSNVYRYVLQFKKEELIPLNTEVEFIKAYVYLLKRRFGEQLKIEISIPDQVPDHICIPPLSLQLLIENAIKHNKISLQNPLFIKVFIETNKYLKVQNTYNPKPEQNPGLAKTGLDNIRKRYQYLSDTAIEVLQDESYFTVRLPLLEMF
ncbi:sensor histidine kinase [Arcticibacter eurypsychrophilus]|uniref:sensor histidine kinase n=1 Tax=Arcticibacter eurypsychrophilus TaxID=1434752 RepID=UPI001FDF0C7E|nr:histidine kinase [Arcticibacter eurypsychrophilus]